MPGRRYQMCHVPLTPGSILLYKIKCSVKARLRRFPCKCFWVNFLRSLFLKCPLPYLISAVKTLPVDEIVTSTSATEKAVFCAGSYLPYNGLAGSEAKKAGIFLNIWPELMQCVVIYTTRTSPHNLHFSISSCCIFTVLPTLTEYSLPKLTF